MRMIILAIIASVVVAFVAEAYWSSAGFDIAERNISAAVRLD